MWSGWVGEGWSLSLGSISADVYTAQDAGGAATWFSFNGAGVSDRLVPNSNTPTSFLTQHISPLKIVQVTSSFGQPCFNVWDASGTEYLFGCTTDSLQYQTDSTGKRTNYRWDLNAMLFANEGPDATSGFPQVSVTYLQDTVTTSGHTTVRDAVIKQLVTKNAAGAVVSTVDFLYKAPFNYSSNGIAWASAFGNNYNCTAIPNHPVPNPPTTLRCDDPLDFGGSGLKAPAVISTFSLQSLWNHAGDDTTNTNLAYRYDFTYTDHPFWSCWDDWTQIQENCSGDHLLTTVTPTVYLKGTGYPRKGLSLTYNTATDEYLDTTHTVPSQPTWFYSAATYWNYLSAYMDTDTAQGASVTYKEAYNNTHGSPATSDDNRIDPFYCPVHQGNPNLDCSGSYANPDDRAWTYEVVRQITSSGSDSSAAASATFAYTYGLQVTATSGCPTFQGDSRCVGDNWLPAGSSNFLNYYQAEFRGFANVFDTSPAGELTLQSYYSTEGWYTNANSFYNYLGGSLLEEQHFAGNWITDPVLRDTVNSYAGTMSGNHDSCNGNYSGLYTPCAVLMLRSKTTMPDANTTLSAPWVQQDNTYDDFTYLLVAGYNNLTQQVVSSSNAPTFTRKWSYSTNDQSLSGWTYHTVNSVSHSEVDDSTGKVWSCQDSSYDQGVVVNAGKPQPPTPAQGLLTTGKTYSDCANQGSTAITSYAGYDGSGSAVATVDGVGAANPSFYGSTGLPSKNGCTLSSAPAVFPTTWGKTNYSSCTVYDGTLELPTSITNAFSQQNRLAYDLTQGGLPTSRTDANLQVTALAYSIDSHGNRTTQVSLPGEGGAYTSQSSTNSASSGPSTCPSSIPTSLHLPCYEIDNTSSLYTQAISSTSYDAQGRAVETRAPGPDATHDTIVFTVYNDAVHSVFQSVPFEVAHGTGWVDPNGAIDPGTGKPVTGTATFFDALGRVIAVQDPAIGSAGDGIPCFALTGSYTACSNYDLGTASGSGDNNIYALTTSLDPNKHVSVSFADVLGRTVYLQEDSGLSGGTLTPIQLKSVQYNVLNEPISVTVTDKAPQANQTTTSITTTAQYDSLGRLTQLADPDRGTHTLTYDADGHRLTDVSGTRTLGTNYDLLGRVGCLQDAAPTTNATGACSAGHALVQNTYDVSAPGVSWPPTDYPIGRLTQSVATTLYPQGASGSVTQSSEYDQRGRVITQQQRYTLPSGWNVTTPLPTYQVALGYNDANQLTTTTTSTLSPTGSGFTTSQVYDSTTGVQTGLSKNLTAVPNLASLSFNSNAQVGDLKVGTSTDTSTPTLANEHFTYDGNLRPLETTATWLSGSGSTGQIFDQGRWYDPASNVVSLATTHAAVPGQSGSGGSETSNFCYNEQNQLVWAGNSGSQPGAGTGTCGTQPLSSGLSGANYASSFAYTHLGQLWQGPLAGSNATSQYLYCTAGTHQLDGLYPTGTTCSTKSGALYTSSYDAFGNVTSRVTGGATSTLSYDALDHLSKWSSGANTEHSLYDAGGNRVLRRSVNGSATTITTYAFGLEEHSYDGTGTLQSNTYYYTLGGRLIGELTGSPTPLNTSIFLADALGSILATFNNTAGSAALLGNQVYGPYGTQRYNKGAMGTNKGFTGQYNDTLTGLDYYNTRYYDPAAAVILPDNIILAYHDDQIRMLSCTPSSPKDL